MSLNNDIGRVGENYASRYLISIGHKILFKNYYSKINRFELDLVSQKNSLIIFTEVKSTFRSGKYSEEIIGRIDKLKMRNIQFSARNYINEFNPIYEAIRIDAIFCLFGKVNGISSSEFKIIKMHRFKSII